MVITNIYLQKYMLRDALDELANDLDYRFFRAELPDIRTRIVMQNSEMETLEFFKFSKEL